MYTKMFDAAIFHLLGREMTDMESELVTAYIGEDLVQENNLLISMKAVYELGRSGDEYTTSDTSLNDLFESVYRNGYYARSKAINRKRIESLKEAGYTEEFISGYTVLSKLAVDAVTKTINFCDFCDDHMRVHMIFNDFGCCNHIVLCDVCDNIHNYMEPEGTAAGIII